jgi:non-specific serine/threonine protein kinase
MVSVFAMPARAIFGERSLEVPYKPQNFAKRRGAVSSAQGPATPQNGSARAARTAANEMPAIYELGPFRLDTQARVLTHAGAAVPLGARGVAVLSVLVSRANEYVQKSAILEAAWPGLVVEEANLSVQVSAMRRALALAPGGEGWIETLPRRGYRFVGPVKEIAARSVAPLLANRKCTNLPESLTSFVGRERELAEIKQTLPTKRLVTLTGIGGLGKTRLAQKAAAELLDAYRDGVWFVDLAPLGDPALVPSALAQVLEVKEAAGQPLLTALCNHLRTRQALLIFDNCEHVLDGCVRMTEALLSEATQVTVMATSREALHVAGECAYPLSPLPLPDPRADAQSIARSDAVRLFTERARQHRPRLDLEAQRSRTVAEICVRLEGIPLALELAAARVAVLPLEQILRLLTERFRLLTGGDRSLPRHQTLRAMLDWSYDLLDDTEKKLFARLSVFAGGWTLEAASQVCSGAPLAKDDVVYALIRLIEQSLVVAEEDGDRYRMLETVRQYARELLEQSGEGSLWRKRHMEHFLALSEEADPHLIGNDQQVWLDRLEAEHDNLRAALSWSCTPEATALSGLRLAAAVWRFWLVRGYRSEGSRWMRTFLDASPPDQDLLTRAKALNGAAALFKEIGDYAATRTANEECLAIHRSLDNQHGISVALSGLGNLERELGNYSVARGFYEEALVIHRALARRWNEAIGLGNLGLVAYDEGDRARALTLYEQALEIFRELGDRRSIAMSLNNLGVAALNRGDASGAKQLHEESMAIFRELGDRWGIGTALTNLGKVASEQGDYALALQLLKEGLSIRQELGERWGVADALEALGFVAFNLWGAERAVRIWMAAEHLRREIGAPRPPGGRARYDRHVAVVRAAVGDDTAFDAMRRKFETTALDEAIDGLL